ncbi:MAG: hypothetical protein A2015_09985 [Spirochaetes bacterium GWF1_31_7]|nr:MAG: hypothetical protein A2Y30_10740 [Spirochaetes bacterium GWE1_32_154]OHD48285.1 MAG: hypothetical protein A2015_09985 [Spirochaetes bacterium GWF1_31_7]OHD51847.1 MAG: hypothetical protein A2Y29_17350 [Spirochaetes bacterium GWE2_31_10]HBD94883.1 hypothetical protein [Spirochaetia bacterium]HBI37304.1 hypothetical protein [Spirochaetia bacterium]
MEINNLNKRVSFILYSFLFFSLILIGRIIFLSTQRIDDFTILQENQKIVKRGEIVDRNNRILAINDEFFSIYANPKEITDFKVTAKQLSEITGENYNDLYTKLSSKKKFIWIKRFVSPNETVLISKAGINGINYVKEYKRIYPNKSLASHILGFCNIDNQGVEGIEKSFNSLLLKNTNEDNETSITEKTNVNIQLTIDSTIQAIAQKSLTRVAELEGAEIGSLILIDGYTGDILALANYPDYDPNLFSNFSQKDFRNNSIFYQFEPGSIFKIFSLAAVLDKGEIDENSHFFCDRVYEKGPYKVKCTGTHNDITLEGIFKYSCNDGTLQASEHIKDFELFSYLKAFGFGELTGIELPGEQTGILRKPSNWSQRSMLSIPIGQEVSVNALQIAQACTTFINDGVMLQTNIIKKIYDTNGTIILENNKKPIRRVLKSGISEKIITAMRSATDTGGTVSRLKIDNLRFAAKSGTAQIYDSKAGSYSNVEVSSSLITLFPLEYPRYIALAAFHKPTAQVRWGGVICANLFNEFIGGITGYLNIYPAEYVLPEDVINTIPVYEKIENLPAAMPDLTGLTAGDALDIFSQTAIKLTVKGSGRITKQSITPGISIDNNSLITLILE